MGMVWVADLGEVEVVCFSDFYLQKSIDLSASKCFSC